MRVLTGGEAGGPRELRRLLGEEALVPVPGVYDALGARLVEEAGFRAAYMSGFGVSASALGAPDAGLLTMSEMVEIARRICGAVGIPVIADADTGYGGELNVIRTVRSYEAAGVAGLHIEDQTFPKKCGHVGEREVIPPEEMVRKIQAALYARESADLVIIARTDARGSEGLEGALERARLYREAGADAVFVEAPRSEEEVAAVAEALPDVPLVYNRVEGGRSPLLPLARLEELGYRIVLFPVSVLLAATAAVRRTLESIREGRSPAAGAGFGEFLEFIGMYEVQRLEDSLVEAGRRRDEHAD